MEKEELIIAAAAKVHEDWCMEEYKAFYNRAVQVKENGRTIKDAWNEACFKGNKKRNEIDLDVPYLVGHDTLASTSLDSFENFMALVRQGGLDVKRFTGRNLTDEEMKEAVRTRDYKVETGEENILRDFKYLSADSQKENLEAAISAYSVFEEMCKSGYEIEDMTTNSDIRALIGMAIHADWIERNPDHADKDLLVPYEELDEWTKDQDLTVFDALVSVVQRSGVVIAREEGYALPDYRGKEEQALKAIRNKKI